jgi:hypothetical protein
MYKEFLNNGNPYSDEYVFHGYKRKDQDKLVREKSMTLVSVERRYVKYLNSENTI